MHITIDTSEALSDTDKAVLAVLSGGAAAPAPAAAPKAAKPVAAAEPAAPAPAPAPAAPEPAGDDPMAQAVALATALVNADKRPKLKEILEGIGAKRVTELAGAKLQQFIDEAGAVDLDI